MGEKISLGFVEETEKQVVKHLEKHLDRISKNDKETIDVLKTMRNDEDEHAKEASDEGAKELKQATKKFMGLTAKIMTSTSEYI
jgi:ubiquinone biosynthesis monooxygenase Coq7